MQTLKRANPISEDEDDSYCMRPTKRARMRIAAQHQPQELCWNDRLDDDRSLQNCVAALLFSGEGTIRIDTAFSIFTNNESSSHIPILLSMDDDDNDDEEENADDMEDGCVESAWRNRGEH